MEKDENSAKDGQKLGCKSLYPAYDMYLLFNIFCNCCLIPCDGKMMSHFLNRNI